jgi:TfoX/Sxy family transcriptional regulator of competence genes
MPKADKKVETFFKSLLPTDSRITVRPMFGHAAAFINGNMFEETFGERVFVRLSEKEGLVLMAERGAMPFAPMEGKPMKGYVVLPSSWSDDPARAKTWLQKSLKWVAEMAPKKNAETN